MAERFTDQATAQLNPYFQQQETAVKAQLPAIQQLYDVLLKGLEGQRQTETQNILESASQRGVLRSTLPVDLQTQLGAALLGERGKLESQRAGDVAGVNKSLADIGLQRSSSISSLADALQARDLQERDFSFRQQQSDREFQLSQQKLQAEVAASRASGGGGGSRDVSGVVNTISGFLQSKVGKDGKVNPATFQQGKQQWVAAGGDPDSYNQAFAHYINQSHYWDYLGRK